MKEKNLASILLFLFGIWVIFSGLFNYMLVLGIIFIVAIVFFTYKIYKISDYNIFNQVDIIKFFLYLFYLLWQIIKSNFSVALTILTGKSKGEFVEIKNETKTEIGSFILANSITITPGTITINYDSKKIMVHTFSEKIKKDLIEDNISKTVKKIEVKNE